MNLYALPYWSPGPWPSEPIFRIGQFPIQIQPFGLMVALGIFAYLKINGPRSEKKYGINRNRFENLSIYIIGLGWLISHIVDVLVYEPQKVLQNPLILFDFTGSISSYGGFIGGLLLLWLWVKRNPDFTLIKASDMIAWGIPIGWFFGRMGCALVHDHPGRLAGAWPLAVEFADPKRPWLNGPRHDLGFYEAIWWAIIVVVFFRLDKKIRPEGYFVVMLGLLYTPIRFSLDFLRVSHADGGDTRYFGLTPGQYFSLFFFCFALYLLKRLSQSAEQT